MGTKTEGIEPIYEEIGERIRWMRKQKGMSSAELSSRLGVHVSSISAWEGAVARPSLAILALIADACGADLTIFLADLDVTRCRPSPATIASRRAAAAKRAAQRAASMRKNGTRPRRKKGAK